LSLTTNSSWLPWGRGLPCLSPALWCQYPIVVVVGMLFHSRAVQREGSNLPCLCTAVLWHSAGSTYSSPDTRPTDPWQVMHWA